MKKPQTKARASVASRPLNAWIPYSILVGLILLRFLPFAVGTTWLWGVGHLTLLPSTFSIAFGLVGALILILPFFAKTQNWADNCGSWFSATFVDHHQRYICRGLFVLAAGATFAFFPTPTHFLGDGQTYLANIASEGGHWIKWSEGGGMMTVMWLRSLLGKPSEETALTAFRIVSIASGLITAWFYFLIAQRISSNPTKRMLAFSVLFFSSSLLLYFGYVESYPIFWAPVVGFLYFSYAYSTEGRGAIPALVCLLIAGFLHLQAGMFVPAFIFLLLSRGSGYRLYKRFRIALQIAAGLVILAGGMFFFYKFSTNLALQGIFLLPFTGKPAYPEYAAFSFRHLSDILNALLLVYPVGLLILVLAWKEWRRRVSEPTTIYFGLLTVGSVLFLLLVDPGLSMPRDWDLFASCWIAPIILLLHVLPDSHSAAVKRLALPIVLASVLCVLPWLLVNLHTERSVMALQQIIDNNREKSFGTLSLLQSWYRTEGHPAQADSLERLRQVRYPRFFTVRRAWQDLQAGKTDIAEQEFYSVPPDRFSLGYHRFLSALALRRRQFDSALDHAEKLIQLAPYFDEGYIALAEVYFKQNQPEKALASLRRGYAYKTDHAALVVGLEVCFVNTGRYDSALVYGKKAIDLDSSSAQAYLYAALACKGLAQHRQAHDYALRCLAIAKATPAFASYGQQALAAFPDLRDSIQAAQRPTDVAKPENSATSERIN